ncbi:MAG: hypothetical protein V1797_15125 [Pseudomonadota bacterium]
MDWRQATARWGLVLVLGVALLAGLGCSGQKSVDNFRKVKAGMTAAEVRGLLGEPDSIKEATGVAGVWTYEARTWYGGFDASMSVTFLGERVMLATLTRPSS